MMYINDVTCLPWYVCTDFLSIKIQFWNLPFPVKQPRPGSRSRPFLPCIVSAKQGQLPNHVISIKCKTTVPGHGLASPD